jgi:hypothetical protein
VGDAQPGVSDDGVLLEAARDLNKPRGEQHRPVKVDELIPEIVASAGKCLLDLDAVNDGAADATGVTSEC